METMDIPNQEIFAAGTWNGDTYEVSDLDRMVEAYQATAENYRPKIKLTHDHPKGWPAVGYMDNIRRVGSKLMADFKGIPAKVFEAIQAKGYEGKSAEVLWNVVVNGKKFPYLLKAVALLGVDMPAVQSISDLMSSLYSSDGGEARAYRSEAPQGDSKTYDLQNQEDTKMDKVEQLTNDLATANAKLAQVGEKLETAEGNVKQFSSEIETLKGQVSDLTRRAEKAEGEVKTYAEKEVTAKVTSTIDGLIKDGKLAPAMKEKGYALIRAIVESGTEKKYKLGDKEQTIEEVAVELLGAGKVDLNTSTQTYAGDRPAHKDDKDNDINTDLADKAKAYQAKHPEKSYADSLRAVAREEGIDPSLRK